MGGGLVVRLAVVVLLLVAEAELVLVLAVAVAVAKEMVGELDPWASTAVLDPNPLPGPIPCPFLSSGVELFINSAISSSHSS